MDEQAGYKTQAQAVAAGKVSEMAEFHRAFAVVRYMTGRYGYQGSQDEPYTPMVDGGAMQGGRIVARYAWSSRTRKWVKMHGEVSPFNTIRGEAQGHG